MRLKKEIDELVEKNKLEEALNRLKQYAISKRKINMEKAVINLSRKYHQDKSTYLLGMLPYEEYRDHSTEIATAILNLARAKKDDDNFTIEECQVRIEHPARTDSKKIEIIAENYEPLLRYILQDPTIKIKRIELGSIIISFYTIRYALRRLIRAYDSGKMEKIFESKVSYIKTLNKNGMEKEIYIFRNSASFDKREYKAYILPSEEANKPEALSTVNKILHKLKARISESFLEPIDNYLLNQYFAKTIMVSSMIAVIFTRADHQKHLIDKFTQPLNSDPDYVQKLITKNVM